MQPYSATPSVGSSFSILAGSTILQIIPKLDGGGAERTTLDTAAALAAAGARALVASEGGRLVAELQASGGIWIPFAANEKNPLFMAANVRKLSRLIRGERVALVHARSRAPAWVALAACRATGTPFATTYHGDYGGRGALKLAYNSVMARGDLVVANSLYTRDLVMRNFPWARDRLRVVVNGSDLRRFRAEAVDVARVERLRTAWGIASSERIVLLAARLTAWKGQRVLIEAATRLASAGLEGTVFVLAGEAQARSAYVDELEASIEKAGVGGVVRLVGHCEDMPAALKAASVVVVPSTKPETFGRVAVEAQSMGTPVVVSDLGPVGETVVASSGSGPELRTGWRVPAGDPQALADAVQAALLLDDGARRAMAVRSRAHVEERFSVDRMARDMLDAYATLLGVPARAR